MTIRQNETHLSAERLQAFLGGELSKEERSRAEAHLSSCARCAAEIEGWRTLFEAIEDLPTLAPEGGFAERVMARVTVSPRLSWAARVRAALAGRKSATAHPTGTGLQDFVEGLLPARQAARVRTHLDACPACASETTALRAVVARLDTLGRLEPSEGFAERVMREVHIPAAAQVAPQVAPQATPTWSRALIAAAARMGAQAIALVPRSRKVWAAVSGVALTPAVTAGLVFWTVFSHPALTPGALVSFAWWKVSDLATSAWQVVASSALESTGLFEVYSMIESLSPMVLAGAFVAFSVGVLSATWVLYRNLFTTHSVDGQYAHASLS